MSQTVIGLFRSKEQAEEAIRELKARDFDDADISLVAKGEGEEKGNESFENQNLADGTATGGAIGGLAGLLAGAGALLIPGIGPIIAAGPLAGALTGIVTGGIAGGLIDYGIPEEEGERYEQEVHGGNILVAAETDDEELSEEVTSVFRENGAYEVKAHE
ncbi:MAG: general stress protein [Bacillota bacterium]|nr:general stress protein [Bacillota bacterium]MDW7682514.1 general stress protein [Bacillota bacterium]